MRRTAGPSGPRGRPWAPRVLLGFILGLVLLAPLAPFVRGGLPPGPQPLWTPPVATTKAFNTTADAAILSSFPSRNLGGSFKLLAGADPANATVARSALQFAVRPTIPSTAKVLAADLALNQYRGPAGQGVGVYRVRAPWTEGTGTEFLYRQTIWVNETAGYRRTRETVDVHLAGLPPNVAASRVRADFRVFDSLGNEVPSQVYNVAATGGNVTSVNVVFESSNAPLESRAYTLYYGTILRTIPPWRTKALPPSGGWSPSYGWVNDTIGSKYATMATADLLGDGRLEVIEADADDNTIYAFRPDGSLLWKSNAYTGPIDIEVTTADLDHDGRPEVIFSTNGNADHRVYVLNGTNGQPRWDTGSVIGGSGIQGAWAVGDTNGDGRQEIYVADYASRQFDAFNYDGTLMWTYPVSGDTPYSMAVANVTGDATPEVIGNTNQKGAYYVFRNDWTTPFPNNPTLLYSGLGPSLTRVPVSVADTVGTGQPSLIWGTQNNPRMEVALNPVTGATVWSYGTGTALVASGQVIVDWSNDSKLETAFLQSSTGVLTVVNATGVHLWDASLTTNGTTAYALPAAADVTMDGEEDVVEGGFDGALYIVNSTGSIVRRYQLDNPIRTTPIIADLDGDGTLEIVVSTHSSTTTAGKTYVIPTGSLGHDWRVAGYNHRHTGLWLDGNSPDGAPLLAVRVGAAVGLGGSSGITWLTRDGTTAWAAPGTDHDPTPLALATSVGVGAIHWNITALVQGWVNNSIPSTGLLVMANNEAPATDNTMTFYSREASGTRAVLTVTYINDVFPHILGRIPDQVKPENSGAWNLDLTSYAYDPDDPPSQLAWAIDGATLNGSLVRVLGSGVTGNMILNFTPLANAYGNDHLTIYLRDLAGHTDSAQFWVNVTHVNQAPIFTPPSLLYVHYDKAYAFNFTYYMADPDNPVTSLTLTTDDPTHTTVVGRTVTFLYPKSLTDTWQFVVVTVHDPGGLTAAQVIGVRVTSDNPPVVAQPLPDVTLREGQTLRNVFNLDNYFNDPDHEALYFTSGNLHVSITIRANHSVDMSAPRGWSGTELVNFQAKDPTGAIATDAILVTVIHVNNPPVIRQLPPLVVHYSYPYVFNVTPYISDLDNTTDQLRVTTSNPNNVTVQGKNLVMLYPPVLGVLVWPYTLPLIVYVSDGLNQTFSITTVTVTNDYPPVVVRTLPDVTYDEDTVLRNAFGMPLGSYFQDNDSSTIYYTSGNVNVTVAIRANNSVDFGAQPNWNGLELVTFRATDDRGALTEDTIKALVNPVDDAPYWKAPIPDQVRGGPGSWFLDLTNATADIDNPLTDLRLSTDRPEHVRVVGLILLFDYDTANVQDTVTVTVSDGLLKNQTLVHVVVRGPDIFTTIGPWVIAGAVAAGAYFITHRLKTTIEEVFLIHGNGLPLAHLSRSLTPEKDPDLVASLFTAIRSFARDSFQGVGAGEIRGLELGSHRVYVAQGSNVFLAVLYRGRSSKGVAKRAEEVLKKIEATYGEVLKNWSGMVDEVAGVRTLLESFYGAKASENVEALKALAQPQGKGPEGGGRSGEGDAPSPPPVPPPPPS